MKRIWSHCVVVSLCVGATDLGWAAGMFLTPRGVHGLSRGGAYVAGASDVGALGYNPAGLAVADNAVLLDVNLPSYTTRYTRRVGAQSDPEPAVTGTSPRAPIPTVGVAHDVGLLRGLKLAAGVLAEVSSMQNWPERLEDGSPAPQRYAFHGLDGSVLAKGSVGLAYRISDWLTAGATVQVLFGSFVSTVTVSNCDGVICTQPENDDYDAVIRMSADRIVAPGLQAGVIIDITDSHMLGLDRSVAGSEVKQTNPTRPPYPGATAIGNGSYSGSAHVLGVGVHWLL